MAAPRIVVIESGRTLKDEESLTLEDSPTSKKPRLLEARFPLTRWEFAAALGVFLVFSN
uniref:Uncharacterized protein n=1 Tax=Kalanchoe fedtschenkoi TaxID=63787 RepID=A0A7N0V9R8_KALFE